MAMIAFADFVVVSHNTITFYNERKAILETVAAACRRLGQCPRYQFNERLLINNHTAVEKQPGLHARQDGKTAQVLSRTTTPLFR